MAAYAEDEKAYRMVSDGWSERRGSGCEIPETRDISGAGQESEHLAGAAVDFGGGRRQGTDDGVRKGEQLENREKSKTEHRSDSRPRRDGQQGPRRGGSRD